MVQDPDIYSDRILRCIVFSANGDPDRLEQAIDLAKQTTEIQ